MKLFVAALLVAFAAADRLENTYLPPSSSNTAGGSGSFLSTPKQSGSSAAQGGFGTQGAFGAQGSFGAQGAFGKPSSFAAAPAARVPAPQYGAPSGPQGHSANNGPQIRILKFDNVNNGDGSYRFEYETENKISQQEAGEPRNLGDETPTVVQGSYSYTSPEGQVITVNYIADENGFQPIGEHLPTPPPVPEAILKSIQLNAAAANSGASAGSYNGAASGSYQGSQPASRQYLAPNQASGKPQGYQY